jgi:hypothetical protein
MKDRKIVGNIAEKIVTNYFAKDHKIEVNTDEFCYWDIKIDEQKVQVKALTPFVKFDNWSIKATASGKNIEHLEQCDKLLIVSVPCIKPSEWDGYLLEVDMSKCRKEVLVGPFNPHNRVSFVIPRRSDCVKKLYKLSKEEEKLISDCSVSTFAKR